MTAIRHERDIARTVDGVGWGLFFIWLGVALLMDVGWGIGVLGVGVITLGAQAARKYVGLPVERFSVALGLGLCIWGLLDFGAVQIPGGPLPILFIAVGVVLVVSASLRRTVAH